MNPSQCFHLAALIAMGLVSLACSDSFEDQPPGPSLPDGSAGGGGSGGTGGVSGEAGTAGTQAGGSGGDDADAGEDAEADVGPDDTGVDSADDVWSDAGQCTPALGDCDSNPANGCETPLDTVDNCGSCDVECTTPANATAECENGTCGFQCTGTYEDCDGDAANGCEKNTQTDPANCGGCDAPCPSGGHGTATCSDGTCGIDCATGWGDCDGELGNGCEIELTSDVSHCGGCGEACPIPANSTPTCSGNQCGFSCLTGWGDCDGNPSNGCEVNLNDNTSHCGVCGHACGSANGNASCSGGACSIVCSPSFGDCDGGNANGCEADLTSTADHCGTCGHDCVGGGCSDAYCSGWPLAIMATDYPKRIAVNATHVYFTTTVGVYRVPITGGSPTLLATSSNAASIAIDETHVYWATLKGAGDNEVLRVPLEGGTVASIVTVDYPWDVSVDGANLYWSYDGGIRKRSKLHYFAFDVVTGYEVGQMVLDEESIYFVVDDSLGKVASVPKAGGAATDLNWNQDRPKGVAVDDDWVYFTVFGLGIVKKVGKDGAGTTVLASGYATLVNLDVDDEHVFFTDSTGGLVVQTPKTYAPSITRHSGGYPSDIVVRNGVVYWTDIEGKSVYAMVK